MFLQPRGRGWRCVCHVGASPHGLIFYLDFSSGAEGRSSRPKVMLLTSTPLSICLKCPLSQTCWDCCWWRGRSALVWAPGGNVQAEGRSCDPVQYGKRAGGGPADWETYVRGCIYVYSGSSMCVMSLVTPQWTTFLLLMWLYFNRNPIHRPLKSVENNTIINSLGLLISTTTTTIMSHYLYCAFFKINEELINIII